MSFEYSNLIHICEKRAYQGCKFHLHSKLTVHYIIAKTQLQIARTIILSTLGGDNPHIFYAKIRYITFGPAPKPIKHLISGT